MELLKIIAIFFIGYYAIKYLFRLLMPFALRKMGERLMRKAQQSAYQTQQGAGGYQQHGNPYDQFKQTNSQRKGEVHVDFIPQEEAKNRKGTQTAGEFVDFEEIK